MLEQKILTVESSILVGCGGPLDDKILRNCGFKNVKMLNVVPVVDPDGNLPESAVIGDIEALDLDENSYDFSIVHEGLHHCASPHAGLLGMYRVARHGVLFFEPRDNWFTRLGVRVGFGQKFEFYSVAGKTSAGGLRNTGIPNLSTDGRREK